MNSKSNAGCVYFLRRRPRKRKLGDEDGGGLLKVMIGLFLDIQMRDIAGSESSHSKSFSSTFN